MPSYSSDMSGFLKAERWMLTITSRDQSFETAGIVERRLNDGRTFKIVKIFYEPSRLAGRLGELGWAADVRATPHFFIYGRLALKR